MTNWGVSFGSHDAALAVIDGTEIKFASHSERFSKIKNDSTLDAALIDHAISKYGHPTRIFYYEKPWKKKLRYLVSRQWRNLLEPTPLSVLKNHGVNSPVVCIDHHYSHAAAGYLTSSFSDATIVVVDAIGELATTTIWEAQGSHITKVYQQNYPNSIGLLYSSLTQAAGFNPSSEEYIFMGLSAYGDPNKWFSTLLDTLVDIQSNSTIVKLKHNLHKGCTAYIPDDIESADLAAAGQKLYEFCLQRILQYAYTNFKSKNLVFMGGCALNCVANSKILSWNDWNDLWIMPNPGDAGSALGAVLAGTNCKTTWKGPYLGYHIKREYPTDKIVDYLINSGPIIGVANGPAEFGPRALGNRSILADPRVPNIKQRMNWLKKREGFRPFAAVIPEELAPRFFQMEKLTSSPYMQFVFKCKDIGAYPGIAHIDNTCRIQTVSAAQHVGLYNLLHKWYVKTGCPMLVNTSLNIKDQPLVNDEHDAFLFQQKYNIPVF